MKFGVVSTVQAEGALLAHALTAGDRRFKKGHRINAEDRAHLAANNITQIIAAVLEAGDVGENEAAACLATAFAGTGIGVADAATGRVNLHASLHGLFRVDKDLVDALNAIDPAITFACLADRARVVPGDMVATIKIIPLAVLGAALGRAALLIGHPGLCAIAPFRPWRAGLIATCLPTLKPSVMDKTRELTAARLAAMGSTLVEEVRVAHDAEAVSVEIARMAAAHDLVILFGASAVTDPGDVLPQAIRQAGGRVERVGMPVDPGNLLVLGSVGEVPVVAAPGCARSPKDNGFDWILARLLTGESPSSAEIAGLGVGGLLLEIPTRPQPRLAKEAHAEPRPQVTAVLLAAGRASRMGAHAGHKLLAAFDGEALVRRMARVALSARLTDVVVVTGHRASAVAAAIKGLDVQIVENPNHATGMASSLKAGLAAVGSAADGALVLLSDMPALTSAHLDVLVTSFEQSGGRAIVRACDGQSRGNPVILPRAAFAAVAALAADVGARAIVDSGKFDVVDVDIGPAARLDVDTPDAVRAAGGTLEGSGPL